MSSDPPSLPSLFAYSPKWRCAGVVQRRVVTGELHKDGFLVPRPLIVCGRSRDGGGTEYKGLLVLRELKLSAWIMELCAVSLLFTRVGPCCLVIQLASVALICAVELVPLALRPEQLRW